MKQPFKGLQVPCYNVLCKRGNSMLIIKRPANARFRVPTVSKEEQALVDAYRTLRHAQRRTRAQCPMLCVQPDAWSTGDGE